MLMSRLPVPAVTVVTGEGGSGGALAIAAGDRVLMMENAYYSVISPEGCSTILFKDATAAPRAAKALRITSPELLRLGVMDAVVPEPRGRRADRPRGRRRQPQGRDRRQPRRTAAAEHRRADRPALRALSQVRHPRAPAHTSANHRGDMSDNENTQTSPDRELIESVWAEARDLIKRLEGSTVQRFAVAAGDYKIEIERGAPPRGVAGQPRLPPPAPLRAGRSPPAPGPGMGIAPGARMASGVFTIGDLEARQAGAGAGAPGGDLLRRRPARRQAVRRGRLRASRPARPCASSRR